MRLARHATPDHSVHVKIVVASVGMCVALTTSGVLLLLLGLTMGIKVLTVVGWPVLLLAGALSDLAKPPSR